MDIVTRLKLFLNKEGIANSNFADTCAIPRPTVSQLLNGRNKKVSDEIISKIHLAYPNLSIMWLMFGEEPMIVPNANTQDGPSAQLAENGVNENNVADGAKNQNLPKSIDFRRNSGDYGESVSNASKNDSSSDSLMSALFAGELKNGGVQSGDKQIVNIVVLYSDNSFATFKPTR